jgi:hypothetical protein
MKKFKLLKLGFLLAILFGASTVFSQLPEDINPINILLDPVATDCGIYNVDLLTQQYINISNISMTLDLGVLAPPAGPWAGIINLHPYLTDPVLGVLTTYVNTAGQLKVSWVAHYDFINNVQKSFTLPDNTVLFTMEFDVNSLWGTSVDLAWDDVLTIDCELSGPDANPIYPDYWNDLHWDIQNQLSIVGAEITDYQCPLNPTGAIDLTVSGGVPPYTFAWTGPNGFTAITEDISGLFPGDYYVTVTDADFCVVNGGPYTVSQIWHPGPREIGGPVPIASTVECATSAVAPTLPVIQDECGTVLQPVGPTMGGTYIDCEGTITFTYVYTDYLNQTLTWVYTYTIEHSTNPAEFGGPVSTGTTIECQVDAIAPTVLPVVKDVCGVTLDAPVPVMSDPVNCGGEITFTYTYLDCAGLPFVWVYTYTILHTTAPAEVGGPVEIASTVECEVDAVAPGTVYQAGFAGDFDPANWTLTNTNGGDGYVDVTGAPANIQLFGANNGTGFGFDNYTVYDITIPIDGNLSFDWDWESFDAYGPYWDPFGYVVDNVFYQLSDGYGPAQQNGSVSINVTAGSMFAFSIFTPDGGDGTSASITNAFLFTSPAFPVVADVCGNILDPVGPAITNNIVDCEGTIAYAYTYTDCANLQYVWTYTYTVDDTEPPTITCPDNVTVFMNDGCTAINVDLGTPDVADNCTANPAYSNDAVEPFAEGTTIVTWTVEDCAGNSATCEQLVTVLRNNLSGTLVYNNIEPFGPDKIMNNVQITLYDDVMTPLATSTTNYTGSYSFPGLCAGTYYVAITNNNKPSGGVNSTDAGQIIVYDNTVYNIEAVRWLAGNTNQPADNVINILDVGKTINNFVYGTPFINDWNYYWAGEMLATNAPPAMPMSATIGDLTTGNYIKKIFAQCTGDFNGNFAPGIMKSASESLTLDYRENILVSSDTEFELPVYAAMDMEVGTISLILNFPADEVEITDVFLTSDPTSPIEYNVKGNELRIGWYTLAPVWLNEGESLITIKMKTSSEEDVHFSLADNDLNELADGNYEVIGNASLVIDIPSTSSLGIGVNLSSEQVDFTSYPNPFKGTTTLTYSLPVDGQVLIEVYNLVGSKVKVAIDETQSAGEYSLNLDASNLQPGVYTAILKLKTSDANVTTRVIKMINR